MGRVVLDSRDYEPKPIVGYADQISVDPGDELVVRVSCEGADQARASLVRVIHGDPHPDGPGYKEQQVQSVPPRDIAVAPQETNHGSCGISSADATIDFAQGFSAWTMICPTLPASGRRQVVLSQGNGDGGSAWALLVQPSGHLAFECPSISAHIVLDTPLITGLWYLVGVSFDPSTNEIELRQRLELTVYNSRLALEHPTESMDGSVTAQIKHGGGTLPTHVGRLTIAGELAGLISPERLRHRSSFNGKIDRPRIAATSLNADQMRSGIDAPLEIPQLIAAWQFHENIGPEGITNHDRVVDVSRNALTVTLKNMPARAMTGYNWTARQFDFRNAAAEYGAIHFHDDDLIDCEWDQTLSMTLPDDCVSGVYAVKLEAIVDGYREEDYVVFFVRPRADRPAADVLLVMPTASYLAYGNDLMATDAADIEVRTGSVPHLQEQELARNRHREFGVSLYDTHSDGSGVCYSSWMRPLLTVRPKYRHSMSRVWQFNADLHLLDWLHHQGYSVDVISDQDLDAEGSTLLSRYKAVLTGSHPEYTSERMLDALHEYITTGGRLAYLGGNGFYWTTAFHPADPRIIEVRRWGGIEAWTSKPGEYFLSTTGEMGGIWRNKGRAPQKLAGVGFVAQGLDLSTYYLRNDDSFEPDGAWIFEGVPDTGRIGDAGLEQGGAAGIEVDWWDPHLGSPGWARVVASSENLSRLMIEVRENHGQATAFQGGDMNPKVRSDITYFKLKGGGGVFSVGSIAWCGSLSANNYNNYPSIIMKNVIDTFISAQDLP